MRTPQACRKLLADQAGQTTVEWALILLFFALPMYWVFKQLGEILAAHYKMLTFIETLPFP